MHPMATATLTQIAQIPGDLAMPIDTAIGQSVVLDQSKQALIFLGALTVGRAQPGVIARPVDPQYPAHRTHPEFPTVGLHEGVLCPYPLAKYAAAFFRMSRSSVTRRNSAFSRRTSALWSTSARCTTHSLYAWLRKFGKPGVVQRAEVDQSAEVRRLKAELRRVTEERDILKKAAAYFAKG